MSAVLDAALDATAAGWSVLPLQPGGKTPAGHLVPRGHLDASSDPDTIRAWWAAQPDAGLGISLEPSGLVALDVDVKNDAGGMASLAEIDSELATTLTAQTKSGGVHFVYARPDGCPAIRRIRFRPGLDLLAAGYIVAAPTPGYQWLNTESPIVPLPAVLTAILVNGHGKRAPIPTDSNEFPADFSPASSALIADAKKRLEDHGPSIKGQGGDKHAFEVGAILLNDYALTWDEAWPLAVWWNERFPENQWEHDRLAEKLRNGGRYPGSPRGGARATFELFSWVGTPPIITVPVPLGAVDLNALACAVKPPPALVRAVDEVDEIYREAALPRLAIGLPELEQRVGGFRAGTLTTTIAPPGFGKTSLYLQIAAFCAERGPAIYWTGELTRAQVLARVVSQRANVSWIDVLDGKIPIERAREILQPLDLHVLHGGNPVESIAAALDQLPADPMPAWFVDYVQIGSAANAEIRQNVMKMMQGLREITRVRQCVGFALAQPNRPGARSLRTGKGDAASAVDLGGESGSIEQDSANVLALSIEMVDGQITHDGRLIVAKARFRGPSVLGVRFHGASGRFEVSERVPDTTEDGESKAEILVEVHRHAARTCQCAGQKLSRSALAGAKTAKRVHGTGIHKPALLLFVKQMIATGVLRDDRERGICATAVPAGPAKE